MNKERIAIVVLVAVVVWFGAAVVRLESYRYAVQVGMCREFSGETQVVEREACLRKVETRTSFVWHLLYGIGVL